MARAARRPGSASGAARPRPRRGRRDEAADIWRGLQKLEHVSITLGSGANAQQIFESLNSTGEPLRDHELIHNYVLMGLSHAEQREIEESFWLPLEENTGEGGFGAAVLEVLADAGEATPVLRLAVPDCFVTHGKTEMLLEEIGLTAAQVADSVAERLAEIRDSEAPAAYGSAQA